MWWRMPSTWSTDFWRQAGEPREAVLPRAGRGVGAVEVPRGILYHMYEFDGDGRIVRADCVIPTGQNHANIQHDIEALAKESAEAGLEDREIEQACQHAGAGLRSLHFLLGALSGARAGSPGMDWRA